MQINTTQVFLLYCIIACMAGWLLYKNKRALFFALSAALFFAVIRMQSFLVASNQLKMIVYNTPKLQAIDFIAGRNYFFRGDSAIIHDPSLQNFHLSPSRILHRVTHAENLHALSVSGNLIRFGHQSILIIDSALRLQKPAQKINIDIVILSKNASISIAALANSFDCQQVVIDGSNSLFKTKRWKKDCSEAGIACHAVSEEGAFVLTLH